MQKNKKLSTKTRAEIIFAEMKGQLIKHLISLKMETPKKSGAEIRHQRETIKRRLTERPAPQKQKPAPAQPPRKY